MIKSNELRLENYIEHNGEYKKVKSLSENVLHLDEQDYVLLLKYDNISGIPLTPEILEKCGFELIAGSYTKKGFELDITCVIDGGYCLSFNDIGSEHYFGETFKYVHQLQNIYYSLMQQELPINL